jgi:hypothetical protein
MAEPACTAAMLDVSALPGPLNSTFGAHLFVLEVQNIRGAACLLGAPQVALEPTSDTNNQPYYAAWRSGDPGPDTHEFEARVLEPGGWAHLLLVWTSRAAPELNCNLYSDVRLGFSYQWRQRNEPEVEVRHLWIRACGPFGVSGYRLGRYGSSSAVPRKWMDWFGTDGLRGVAISAPTASTEIAAASPLLLLSAQAKRTMLGDRLFSLKLKFPRLAGRGCAFSELRKRESDGGTLILMQQCDGAAPDESPTPPAAPPWHMPGVTGLYLGLGNLEISPTHTGPVVYEVTAPVGGRSGDKGGVAYARSRVDLVARDPALPRQAVILDPLPACVPGQLRVDALPAVLATPLRTLRAYNATNLSAQACSLAGVPRTRGLDENGHYQPLLPPACPNCENEMFLPRPNGRIDLKQGETAHLLVASVGKEMGQGRCTTTPNFEFNLNREASVGSPFNTGPLDSDVAQSLTESFGGDDCVAIDVSAWRRGAYDGDPLNLHSAKVAPAAEPVAAVPSECDRPELLAHGIPLPIEGTDEPVYALSMTQHVFVRDEPVTMYVWTINPTDHAIEHGSCSDPGYLKSGGLVLYDAYGHRMLNQRQVASDKQCKADPGGYVRVLQCTASISVSIAAHTCVNSAIDLTKQYELPPGEYTLSTRDPGDAASCPRSGDAPHEFDPWRDVRFTVLQP